MKCGKCGKPIPLSDKHCVYCGSTAGPLPIRFVSALSGRLPTWAKVAVSLLIVCIVIMISYLMLHKDTNRNPSIVLTPNYSEDAISPYINSTYITVAAPVADGVFATGEWQGPAFSKPFDYTMKGSKRIGYLEGYFMNDNDSVYVAIKLNGDGFRESTFEKENLYFQIIICFDSDNNGGISLGDDIRSVNWANVPFTDLSMNANGGYTSDKQQDGMAAAKFSSGEHAYICEFKIPLDSGDANDIAVNPGATLDMRLSVWEYQKIATQPNGPPIRSEGGIGWPTLQGTLGKLFIASSSTAASNPASAETSSSLASSPWPMFGHDAQHTGRSLYAGPESPQLKWSCDLHSSIYSSPALAADGTIYYYVSGDKQKLYAVNPVGYINWSYPLETSDISYNYNSPILSPAIGTDGTIYLAHFDKLYAVNPIGSLKWSYKTGRLISCPVIGADDTIYLVTADKLYAVNPTGSLKWSYSRGDSSYSWGKASLAISADGTILVATTSILSNDGKLYAIDPTGSLKWNYSIGEFGEGLAIGTDGTIYVTTYDKLCAINPDGSLKWSYSNGDYSFGYQTNLAIGSDGIIYVSGIYNNYYKLYALDPNGSLKWSYNIGTEYGNSPPPPLAIDAANTIYISAKTGLYALAPAGTLKWSYDTGNNGYFANYPVVGADGTIYVSSSTGFSRIYAIGDSKTAASTTPVPTATPE